MVLSLLLHVPPGVASVKEITDGAHTELGPEIDPATGLGLTVTGKVVNALAHAVVTV
jgi:hypothetical protein